MNGFNLTALCAAAAERTKNQVVLLHVQIFLVSSTLVAAFWLLISYWRSRVAIHQNFLLIFANIVAISSLNALTYLLFFARVSFLLWFSADGCAQLVPLWLVDVLIGPHFFYAVAHPAFHFALMLERLKATLMADKYEREGLRLSLWMVLGIWLLSLAFMAFVIAVAFLDPAMTSHPLTSGTLSSKYSAQPILYLNILTLPVVVLTALFDWRITVMNRRKRAAKSQITGSYFATVHYSLSRNYQLNENALAMRLILPLDASYALLYSIYLAFSILLRAIRSSMSDADFVYYFNMTNTILHLYSAVTMLVYVRFVKFVSRCQRRTFKDPEPFIEHSKIHFKQLDALWK